MRIGLISYQTRSLQTEDAATADAAHLQASDREGSQSLFLSSVSCGMPLLARTRATEPARTDRLMRRYQPSSSRLSRSRRTTDQANDHHITWRRQVTEAGLQRPLFLRNRLKTTSI